jgi:hypothetical protein
MSSPGLVVPKPYYMPMEAAAEVLAELLAKEGLPRDLVRLGPGDYLYGGERLEISLSAKPGRKPRLKAKNSSYNGGRPTDLRKFAELFENDFAAPRSPSPPRITSVTMPSGTVQIHKQVSSPSPRKQREVTPRGRAQTLPNPTGRSSVVSTLRSQPLPTAQPQLPVYLPLPVPEPTAMLRASVVEPAMPAITYAATTPVGTMTSQVIATQNTVGVPSASAVSKTGSARSRSLSVGPGGALIAGTMPVPTATRPSTTLLAGTMPAMPVNRVSFAPGVQGGQSPVGTLTIGTAV